MKDKGKYIIKAFECCSYNGCDECPYKSEREYCTKTRNRDAVALIIHQKAEIKKLENIIATIKAEAIKECIEKIKSKSSKVVMVINGIPVAGSANYSISEVGLSEVIKEMVGDPE